MHRPHRSSGLPRRCGRNACDPDPTHCIHTIWHSPPLHVMLSVSETSRSAWDSSVAALPLNDVMELGILRSHRMTDMGYNNGAVETRLAASYHLKLTWKMGQAPSLQRVGCNSGWANVCKLPNTSAAGAAGACPIFTKNLHTIRRGKPRLYSAEVAIPNGSMCASYPTTVPPERPGLAPYLHTNPTNRHCRAKRYQAVVPTIPSRGTNSTKPWYNTEGQHPFP